MINYHILFVLASDARKGDSDINGRPGYNKLTNRRRPNEEENLV